VLRIVTYPHPALKAESRPVRRIDEDLRAVVRRMFDRMYEAQGIGLAANQVALPFRFFILNLTSDRERPEDERVFINPEILKRESVVEDDEGCLSLPGLYGKVRRAKKIRARAFDLSGKLFEIDVDGLLSRAIQHEYDHLDGTLITDRFDPEVKVATAAKLREIETEFRKQQAEGQWPDDDALRRRFEARAEAGVVRLEPAEEVASAAEVKESHERNS